jgi:hypothetical protein
MTVREWVWSTIVDSDRTSITCVLPRTSGVYTWVGIHRVWRIDTELQGTIVPHTTREELGEKKGNDLEKLQQPRMRDSRAKEDNQVGKSYSMRRFGLEN